MPTDVENASAVVAAQPLLGLHPEHGLYQVHGVLVGKIDLLENKVREEATILHDPPPGLDGYARLRWIVQAETTFNPLTVYELNIALIGMAWGFFLLLPYKSFDGTGKIWTPIRTFASAPGSMWYDSGAEIAVGAMLFVFHVLHLFAVCHGRRGDAMRCLTICFLLSIWLVLALLFFVADYTVSTYFTCLITCAFLFVSLRCVFRKAGQR